MRKVPPGLPSSVSDKMPFNVISKVLSLFQVCVADEEAADAPACLQSLSCFVKPANVGCFFCERVAVKMMPLSGGRAGRQQLSAFSCQLLFLGNNWKSLVPE